MLFRNKLLFLFLWIGVNCFAQDVKTFIPPQAFEHIPAVNKAITTYWPDHPAYHYFGGLIEHESCISLKHSRCWNAKSRLKTHREEGAGLGQLTRVYGRFDALEELRALHKTELKELSWDNIYVRPDLQIRAVVLKIQDNYKQFNNIPDPIVRMQVTDASYNQGVGKTKKEIMLCGMRKGCNPNIWYGNIEKACSGTNKALYAGRGPCDISRHHVYDVEKNRMGKYKPYLFPEAKTAVMPVKATETPLKLTTTLDVDKSAFEKFMANLNK